MGLWPALVICLAALTAAAQRTTSPARELRRIDGSRISINAADAKIRTAMAKAHVSGLQVAVLNHGDVVYVHSFGFADAAKQRKLTPSTIMYGASFTKAVFAYAVMHLVDEGRLDLDRPLYEYLAHPLGEYESYKDIAADDRYKQITARIVLDHSTGFANWRWLQPDHKLKFAFAPGERYAYSGEGIQLLQLAVENITHAPADKLMEATVFTPFHMTRTSMTWRSDFAPEFAHGYDEQGNDLGHRQRDKVQAAGSMDTTIEDMAKFLAGVLRHRGLSDRVFKEMVRPQIRIRSKQQFPTLSTETTHENDDIQLSYGLGWGVFRRLTVPHSSKRDTMTAGRTTCLHSGARGPQ
ncbi:MAG TPA: serine hydrolase domain-containing protein [Terriglobales bacterium]